MDAQNILAGIGKNLTKAKDATAEHYMNKNTAPSRSGTGMFGPSSFGVNAKVGAPPVSARMAGGMGLQKIANTLIHKGLNEHVMPAINNQMKKVVNDIKIKKHKALGGTFMHKPAQSM